MTAVPLHGASKSAYADDFQLFEVPSTDTSAVAYRMVELSPVTTGINPVEFVMAALPEYVDLSRSYFRMQLRLKKSDDSNLLAANNLFPTPNLAHTLLKQVTVHANGTLISPQTDTYAYKAYLETLLNYTNDEGDTILQPQGWFKSYRHGLKAFNALDFPTPLTANKLDSAGPHADYTALSESQKAAVLESKEAQKRYRGGHTVTLQFVPHSEIFHLGKPLVPNVELKIRFYFNAPAFFLNGVALNGRLQEDDVKLTFHVCQLRLSDPLYRELEAARHDPRKRQVAKYTVVGSEIRVFSHPQNQLDFDEGNLFQGRIPDRLIVGLLHTNAYNGNVAYHPFAFQKFGLTSIKQIVRGEEYPYQTLELNTGDTYKDLDGYHRFLQASEALMKSRQSMIAPEQWGGTAGCTLFMWNNVPSGSADRGMLNPRQDGDVRVLFRLGAAKDHVINVVLYAEFENVLEINPEGAVLYNVYQV